MRMNNQVQLIGRLGQDPELKTTNNGKKVVNMTIATNDYYYDDSGNKIEETQWHNVVAWGKLAENLGKFGEKGKELALAGKLTHRKYDDKEGVTRYVTEVVASDFQLLGSKSKA